MAIQDLTFQEILKQRPMKNMMGFLEIRKPSYYYSNEDIVEELSCNARNNNLLVKCTHCNKIFLLSSSEQNFTTIHFCDKCAKDAINEVDSMMNTLPSIKNVWWFDF